MAPMVDDFKSVQLPQEILHIWSSIQQAKRGALKKAKQGKDAMGDAPELKLGPLVGKKMRVCKDRYTYIYIYIKDCKTILYNEIQGGIIATPFPSSPIVLSEAL